MTADAADECLLLTRRCDTENMDVSELAGYCSEFVANVVDLFGPNRGCLSRPTYTQLVLSFLEVGLVWQVEPGKVSSLAAASNEDIDACLAVMSSWLPLAAATVRAEFPGYELAQVSPSSP